MGDLENTGNGNAGAPPMQVETSAAAAAAREKAVVEARYIVAMKRPRDIDEVRVRLLKECQRPGFAEVAKYEKPVGREKIVGLSVRFAETAIRLMQNIQVNVAVVFDDATRRIVRVEVTDLETNTPYGQDIPIEKTVERSKAGEDREVLGTRKNTQGRTVFIVAATEDEFMNKQNAAISKVLRNHGLRLIPGDILEECSRAIDKTYSDKAAQDPEGEKKKIVDAFASIGVRPAQLGEYLEHPLDAVVPAELTMLRRIYQSIRDGETTWVAVMEEKFGERGAAAERPKPGRKVDAPAPAEDGARSSTSPEEPKQVPPPVEPRVEPTEAPPPAEGSEPASPTSPKGAGLPVSPPNGNGGAKKKLSGALFAQAISATARLDEKMGKGTARTLLEQEYGVTSATQLDEEQANDLIARVKGWMEGS